LPACVERRHLAHQHTQRPAIGDDVVHGDQQDVLGGPEADQRDPQQRTAAQVERPLRLLPGQLLQSGRLPVQIDHRQDESRRGRDSLHREAVHRRKGGA
jgi:hypothetical protein